MRWLFLLFNGAGFVVLFLLQLVQGVLPSTPSICRRVRWDTALNTAISFVTNTNWQAYGGETTMSYLTQMMGMTVQNFVSAASGHGGPPAAHQGLYVKAEGNGGQLLGRHDPVGALHPAPLKHHTGRWSSRPRASYRPSGLT